MTRLVGVAVIFAVTIVGALFADSQLYLIPIAAVESPPEGLGNYDRWRFERCLSAVFHAPTEQGVRLGAETCYARFTGSTTSGMVPENKRVGKPDETDPFTSIESPDSSKQKKRDVDMPVIDWSVYGDPVLPHPRDDRASTSAHERQVDGARREKKWDRPPVDSWRDVVTFEEASDRSNFTATPMPREGVVAILTKKNLIAPLSIETSPSAKGYFAKLVDTRTQRDVLTFFIRGGSKIEIKAPLGTYRLRYASGDQWFGRELLFGAATAYAEADKTLDFRIDGDRINGYAIELIVRRDGNLATKSLSASQF